jgi:two-component system, response regulator, stage 0 sporulation protein F
MLEHVLVVDGEVSSRDTFYEVLSSMGYKVSCVPNGKEAFLRLERERPSLVIIDANLQNVDAYETMSKIHEFDPEISFVLLSKDDLPPECKGKALSMGAMGVIKKDFSNHLMMKEILGILKERLREFKKEDRRGNILVVDDEADIRNMISNFLSTKSYSVVTAASGEEALLSIKTQRPQLVLCDIRMPGMDGLMVLKKILEFDPSIKVVMLSAIQDEDVVAEAFREGAADYLVKPCSLMKLDALVLSILPKSA